MPLAGRLLLLGLLDAIAAAVLGAKHIGHLTALADRLADISAQIRIRLTVLLAAGMALVAAGLGFEAILGALTVIPVTWGVSRLPASGMLGSAPPLLERPGSAGRS